MMFHTGEILLCRPLFRQRLPAKKPKADRLPGNLEMYPWKRSYLRSVSLWGAAKRILNIYTL